MHKRNFFSFLKSIFLMQVFIIALFLGLSLNLSIDKTFFSSVPSWDENIYIDISKLRIDKNMASSLFRGVNVLMAGESNNELFTAEYFNNKIPEELMRSNIQALALEERERSISRENREVFKEEFMPEIEAEDVQKIEKDNQLKIEKILKDARVVFYCTHSAESYIPDSGKARIDGHRGLVNNVAEHIADGLKNKGIEAGFINTIHDFPEYNKSYTNSRETVKKIIDSHEKINALFDLHRDSIPGLETAKTVEINNKDSAQILIIVGTDQRKSHPKWRENMAFAGKLYLKAEKMYPGLVKGVRTKAGTYNQEFHNHALLLEIGSDYNSLAEAKYAGELFADVLFEVLKEEVE